MSLRSRYLLILAAVLLTVRAGAATYHVDFAAGDDARGGQSPDQAWKHSPGDAQATGIPAGIALQPGDRILFKGGVTYRGTLRPGASGTAAAPIVFDGNSAGTWGEGPAILDGSELLDGWRPVASAEEARGNPNWRQLRVAPLPIDAGIREAHLTQGEELLSLARDPAPADPFYLDDRSTMRRINPPRPEDRGRAAIDSSQLFGNRQHPLRLMVDGRDNTVAIIEPLAAARLDFVLPETVTVTRLAITTDARPTRPRDIEFAAGGRTILATTLPDRQGHFEFTLDRPASLQTLTLRIRSIHDGGQRYGGLRRVQAFDAQGRDVLRVIESGGAGAYAAYADADFLTQPRPDHWKGSIFAIHAGSNFIYYRRVLKYFPDRHEIHTEPIEVPQYAGDRGLFAILNALGAIQATGQYYIDPDPDPEGRRAIYLWPLADGNGGAPPVFVAHRAAGFEIRGRQHVTVTGFIIQRHGGDFAVQIAESDHVTVRGNEIRLNRGGAIQAFRGTGLRLEGNHAHHNRGRGFRLHTVRDTVVDGNRLHKNGATGIGFYESHRIEIRRNQVSGHHGVHANALTVYANSTGVLIEGNRTWENNIGLTLQDVTDVVVRNNVLQSGGTVVGLWTGFHRNVRFEHNALIGLEHRPRSDYAGALFTNGTVEGLRVHNNILAGTSGRLPGVYSHNIYTRIGPNDDAARLPEGSRHVTDLKQIFRDPDQRDFRLRPDSPAIDAGVDVGARQDIEGAPRPQGARPDIGPYEHR